MSRRQKEAHVIDRTARQRRSGRVSGPARATLPIVAALACVLAGTGAARAQAPADAKAATGAVAGPPAAAADPDEVARAHAVALRRVPRSCKAEVVRFCPSLPEGARPRDQAICLKYYKTSLSLGCRGAVTAATAP